MSEELIVNVTDVVEVINVTVSEAEQGPVGPRGPSGVTVSHTPPDNPSINDLWVQLPA